MVAGFFKFYRDFPPSLKADFYPQILIYMPPTPKGGFLFAVSISIITVLFLLMTSSTEKRRVVIPILSRNLSL
jgi:hypothetical protein